MRDDPSIDRLCLTLSVLVLIGVPSVQVLEDGTEEATVVAGLVLATREHKGADLLPQKLIDRQYIVKSSNRRTTRTRS